MPEKASASSPRVSTLAAIAKARRMVPSLQHDRAFTKPERAARPLAAD